MCYVWSPKLGYYCYCMKGIPRFKPKIGKTVYAGTEAEAKTVCRHIRILLPKEEFNVIYR